MHNPSKPKLGCGLAPVIAIAIAAAMLLSACSDPSDPGPSANANLSGISPSAGALYPAFRADADSYTVSVPAGTTSIDIAALAEQAESTVEYSSAQPMNLLPGANPLTITVTATNGDTREHWVTVYRDYAAPPIPESGLVYIAGGSFQRSLKAENIMTQSSFYLAETEVTRAQFAAVFGSDPSDTEYSTGSNDPVQRVSWYHAIVFCNLLSLAEGREPVYSIGGSRDPCRWDPEYDGVVTVQLYDAAWRAVEADWDADGYRLPTEMEWMWAAIGGMNCQTPSGWQAYQKRFSGDYNAHDIGDYAWYSENSGEKTHPVKTTGGTGGANELGLYDMSGNVAEYCWDWEFHIEDGAHTDYRGPSFGNNRIYRGGGFSDIHGYCELDNRYQIYPEAQSRDRGFRVARNP